MILNFAEIIPDINSVKYFNFYFLYVYNNCIYIDIYALYLIFKNSNINSINFKNASNTLQTFKTLD